METAKTDLLVFKYIDFRMAGNNAGALACKHEYFAQKFSINLPLVCSKCSRENDEGEALPADETGELLWICADCMKKLFVSQHTIFGQGVK